MAEVGIHLNHIVIAVLVSPAHTVKIGSAQAKFAFALLDEKAVWKFLHKAFDNIGRTVGRVVLDNKHIKLFLERKNLADNILYILFLVVCRRNYQCI